MKNKFLVALIGLTLTLSMVLGILAGCGAPATPPTATIAPTGTATSKPTATAKPTTTSAPTPLKTGEVIQWRCQSTKSAGDQMYWIEAEMVENIKIMSGGRFVWTLFPTGAIVGATECFDAVSIGAIEVVSSTSENTWSGKNLMFEINCIPAGMEQWVAICWTNYHTVTDPVPPGEKLLAGLYEKYNIKAFISGNKGAEVQYMSNKKIIKPTDYKGVTFRGAGWEMEIIASPEFGAKPVWLSGADVYSALMTGVIDALELGTASSNYIGGYADVTKYWGFPGFNNLNQTEHMMINMDVWNKLPADLQKIVELSAHQMMLTKATYSIVESAKILPVLAKKGVVLVYQTPEMHQFWRDMMLKTVPTREKTVPGFKAEWEKAVEFQYMMDAYIDLMHPVYDKTYPGRKEKIAGFVWE